MSFGIVFFKVNTVCEIFCFSGDASMKEALMARYLLWNADHTGARVLSASFRRLYIYMYILSWYGSWKNGNDICMCIYMFMLWFLPLDWQAMSCARSRKCQNVSRKGDPKDKYNIGICQSISLSIYYVSLNIFLQS